LSKKAKINININKDDSELNDFLYCWGEFNSRPNKIVVYNSYLKDKFDQVISKEIQDKNVFTEIVPIDESFVVNDKMLIKINDDIYLSYLSLDRNNENSLIHEITFFYKDQNQTEKINDILSELNNCILDFDDVDDDISNLNYINISNNGLDIENLEFKSLDENIDLYYDKKTFKNINKLIKSINNLDKGLSILHGDRGTGKTSIIKYISDNVNRTGIFIPNNMLESTINNPEFRKFIKKHPNPLLIIDDAEIIFNNNYSSTNNYTTNILQLIDGPISDTMCVSIIMIFNNESLDEVDSCLLDSNNLIDCVEFNYLDIESSNTLGKYLKNKKNYKSETKLIDILNTKKLSKDKKIGF